MRCDIEPFWQSKLKKFEIVKKWEVELGGDRGERKSGVAGRGRKESGDDARNPRRQMESRHRKLDFEKMRDTKNANVSNFF